MIPFLDLTPQTRVVLDRFLHQARSLGEGNRFVGGEPVKAFEEEFARYVGTPYCVALNSGTDALRLALLAAGIGPEEEVITTPFTFIATAEAVSQTARLVLADIDPDTFQISPAAVENAVTTRTRAVLPVHLFGCPAPVQELARLAKNRNLFLIEDACQAHGAKVGEERVGSFGTAAAFSFYPTKNLGAFGDAGAVTCRDETLRQRILRLRNHGQVALYQHREVGFNSRMDTLQAAVLRLKLPHLDGWNQERRCLAALYQEILAGLEEIRFQKIEPGVEPVFHLLGIRAERRDQLKEYLAERGIETRVVYPTPIHLLEAYASRFRAGQFPAAEEVCRKVLCLPLYPGLGPGQVEQVALAIRRFYVG